MHKTKPYDYVTNLTSAIHVYDEVNVLKGPYLCEEFDDELTRYLLSFLNPENLFFYVVASEFEGKTDTVEKWYQTKYRATKVSPEYLEKLKAVEPNPDLSLPMVNEFIPTNFALKPPVMEADFDSPDIIRSTNLVKLWHKQDVTFHVPKADLILCIYSPAINESLASWVMSVLFVDLLQDDLNAYTYYATIAGLSFSMNVYEPRLEVQVRGYNEKLPLLTKKVFETIVNLKIKQDRFILFKQNLSRRYINTKLNAPYRTAEYFWSLALKHKKWSLEDRLAALQDITLESLQMFIPKLLSSVSIEGLIHGNITKEESLALMDEIEATFSPKPMQESEFPEERVLYLEKGKEYLHQAEVFNKNEQNSAIYNFYQIGPENTHDDILLDLFNQINKTTFYDQLRTKEQLGYIVWADAVTLAGVQGLRIEIQSSSYDPRHLDQRSESCIQLAW